MKRNTTVTLLFGIAALLALAAVYTSGSENLAGELKQIEEELKTLTVDERLIAHAKGIEDPARQVSVHTTALADIKKLKGEIHRHNESAQKNIHLLRAGLTLSGIEALRLSIADKAKIETGVRNLLYIGK